MLELVNIQILVEVCERDGSQAVHDLGNLVAALFDELLVGLGQASSDGAVHPEHHLWYPGVASQILRRCYWDKAGWGSRYGSVRDRGCAFHLGVDLPGHEPTNDFLRVICEHALLLLSIGDLLLSKSLLPGIRLALGASMALDHTLPTLKVEKVAVN